MQTDDLAAQMVREMEECRMLHLPYDSTAEREAIARRYIKKARLIEREENAQLCEQVAAQEYADAIRAERAGKDGR